MSSTQSLSDREFLDKYLPTDDMVSEHADPRWHEVEISEGNTMWVWLPATIDYINNAFVVQVGPRIERFADLEAADWWCTEVMDVLPVTRQAALNAPVAAKRIARAAVHVAAMGAGFALVLLMGLVL